jgi:hypothetical protein
MKEIGRLALRVEGDNWVAYYALTDTMKDALFLGSIRMGIVTQHPEHKRAFMALMQEVVGDFIREATGERPNWNEPQSAPEHERSGSA